MGTSSSNRGPSGISSLLPPWYSEPQVSGQENAGETGAPDGSTNGNGQGSNQENPQANTVSTNSTENWSIAKRSFTHYTKNKSGANLRNAAKKYIRTLGGAKGATKSAARGIAVGRSFAGFLGSVSSKGLNTTLDDIGLSALIGRSSEEVLAKIADFIAPPGATNDEAIARDAVLVTLDIIYNKVLENGGDISALESFNPEMIKDAMIEYISVFIYTKWVHELGAAIEKNSITEQQAIEIEAEMKVFIKEEVSLSLNSQKVENFNLNAASNQKNYRNYISNCLFNT